MKYLAKFLPLLAGMMLCPLPACAEDAGQGMGAGMTFATSAENEKFYMQRAGVEFFPAYSFADSLIGARASAIHYEQQTWSRDGQQIGVQFREIDPATAAGWNLEAGIARQGGHGLVTLNTGYRTAFSATTGADLFLERDWVETATALDNGIHFTFGGVAIDHSLTPSFTVVAVAGLQSFSDDNFRNHGRLRLIYQPVPDLGFTIQLRYRAYTSSATAVNYFNPGRYEETMLAAGWRQRLGGWKLNLVAGSGQQQVSADPPTPASLLEFDLQSPPFQKSQSVRLHAIMSRSASFSGPDYQYSLLQGEWILQL